MDAKTLGNVTIRKNNVLLAGAATAASSSQQQNGDVDGQRGGCFSFLTVLSKKKNRQWARDAVDFSLCKIVGKFEWEASDREQERLVHGTCYCQNLLLR